MSNSPRRGQRSSSRSQHVGGGYPLDRSALSKSTLERMIKEAMSKGILVEDLEKAKRIVTSINDPKIKTNHW